jgi:hypothetical protein
MQSGVGPRKARALCRWRPPKTLELGEDNEYEALLIRADVDHAGSRDSRCVLSWIFSKRPLAVIKIKGVFLSHRAQRRAETWVQYRNNKLPLSRLCNMFKAQVEVTVVLCFSRDSLLPRLPTEIKRMVFTFVV